MAEQIFLFYGDEELLIQERIRALKQETGAELEQIDAGQPDIDMIIAALRTGSLLFGSRLLVIKNIDLKDEAWDAVIPALSNVAEATTVVFWAKNSNKRAKLYKAVDRLGEVSEFKSFTDWEQDQVVAWIIDRTTAAGKSLARPAAGRLQEVCGSNLMKLASEIDKLATYVGERRQISEDDVAALASAGQLSVFVLSDAVAEKDIRKALAAWRVLQRNRVELFSLLALLAGRYRIMLLGKTIRDANRIAQLLKASPFYVRKCLAQAERFTKPELERDLQLLLETNLRMKSGESQATVFELLLTALCSPEEGRADVR